MQIFGLFAHGLVASSLAHFKVAKVVNEALGNKDAYNHGVDYGSLVSAMVIQMCDAPHPGMWGVEDFFLKRPLALLLGQHIEPSALNRHALSRCLDRINLFGPERLFMQVSRTVLDVLDITVKESHIDSTSFHYDGHSRQDQYCLIQAKQGYSRDHRPDLNQ